MTATRALLVCVVLCGSVRADFFTGNEVAIRDGMQGDGEKSRAASHRLELLFPLLLRISTRLATLVPTAISALIGIFLFVAFSKKAFIISLLALFLTYLDKYKREEDVIHIHKINVYNDRDVLDPDGDYPAYAWPRRVLTPYSGHRYRPYPYMNRPIRWEMPESLDYIRWSPNRTFTRDFQQFLSDAIDSEHRHY